MNSFKVKKSCIYLMIFTSWQKPWKKNRTQKEQKFENKKNTFISFKHSVIFV